MDTAKARGFTDWVHAPTDLALGHLLLDGLKFLRFSLKRKGGTLKFSKLIFENEI
jgi:hypothetical protein